MTPPNLVPSLPRRKFLGLAALTVLAPASALAAGKSASNEVDGPNGRWLAVTIRNRGVIPDLQTVIEIARDGRVTGSGGCNRISGKVTLTGSRISFGPMISTRMACAPAVMDQESKFLSALGDTRLWRLDEQRDKLILVDAHGVTVMRLARI